MKGGDFVQNRYDGLLDDFYKYEHNNYLDINELVGYTIINETNSVDCCDIEYINTDYGGNVKESCVSCYHSNGKHCSLKNKAINELSPLCWFYADSLTMQPSSDYQCDNDEDF
jgi:hypothetical protein